MKLSLVLLILFNIFVFVVSVRLEESETHNRLSKGFRVEKVNKVCHPNLLKNSDKIPSEIDWRKHNRVTPVQNQGDCDSCWAFGITALIEGQMSNITDLSEQHLLDCIRKGCKGGMSPAIALSHIGFHGLVAEEDYKYRGVNGTCKSSHMRKMKLKLEKFCTTNGLSEQDLKALVAKYGPVLVAIEPINAETLSHNGYKGGVYRCASTSDYSVMDHVVAIVGYGTDANEGDYWIIKNSYGQQWGEKGYLRMAIENSSQCGITRYVTTATIKSVE